MKQTKVKQMIDKVDGFSGDAMQTCLRYGVGRYTIERIAAECNAKIKLGRRTIYNWRKMDDYMNQMSE